MEAVLLAAVCGLAFVLSTLLWHLHVHPDVVLSAFEERGFTSSAWASDRGEAAVRWVKWALGLAVFAVGFIAGAALAFLSATGG